MSESIELNSDIIGFGFVKHDVLTTRQNTEYYQTSYLTVSSGLSSTAEKTLYKSIIFDMNKASKY